MGLTNTPSDLLPGTLELLILSSLVPGAKHGYAIVEHLRLTSRDVLQVGESALYPAARAGAQAPAAGDVQRIDLPALLAAGKLTVVNRTASKIDGATGVRLSAAPAVGVAWRGWRECRSPKVLGVAFHAKDNDT